MRRALVGVVPDQVLNRKRKAYVARAPLVALSMEWASLAEMTRHMVSSSLGIVDRKALSQALEGVRQDKEVLVIPLTRTLCLESWLRSVNSFGASNPSLPIVVEAHSLPNGHKVVMDHLQ
jgi:asparagine synthase (glutamine-hydrolysing)